MQRIDLDFSGRRRPVGVGRWLGLGLGIAALATVIAWNHWHWQSRVVAAEKQLRTVQAALQARQPAAQKMDDTQLAAEWGRAMTVAEELNQPWDKLFATVEAQATGSVALLTFEPDAAKRELVLTAEARNFEAMLGFYRMLGQQDHLSGVVLQSHQVNSQDNEKPVRFRMTAKWAAN
ncbi:MAG: hypothetical protein ACOYNF_14660 [Rhodoferax sp.]